MQSSHDLDQVVTALGRPADFPERRRLVSHPRLAALYRAGTSHVYADTADPDELGELLDAGDGALYAEVDGNTANQPLVGRVIESVLAEHDVRSWAREVRERAPDLDRRGLFAVLYAIACGRIGNEIVRRFASGRVWEPSLQIHMGLVHDPPLALRVGRLLREMVPGAIVKVPFAPHAPATLLVARDLEREGVPVNLTSTFSARQVVVAALLTNAARTNVFMGRIDAGLQAEHLGDHVDLEAQRALLRLRREHGVRTRLIVASMRHWRSFVSTAGCDVYTAPCAVIRDFLARDEPSPEALESRLETSYEDALGVDDAVRERLGDERIARLYRVEPELLEFLLELRASDAFRRLGPADGDALARRFEDAGHGDLFHAPGEAEWALLRRDKLPALDAPHTLRIALDTHYALLADADFDQHQARIDELVAQRLGE